MATVTYTSLFSNLNNWPGQLLEFNSGTVYQTKTATSLVLKHGAGHPFVNYTFNFVGTGLTYTGNTVTGGTIGSLTIKNAAGQTVISITGLSAASINSDISTLMSQLVGWVEPGGSSSGDAKGAIGQLMAANDTITGTSGNDRDLFGLDPGNDTYNMGDGDDQMAGGLGADKYNGGNGFDTVSYQNTQFNEGHSAFRGITVTRSATAGSATVLDPWGGTDTLTGIEEIRGSRFVDKYIGHATANFEDQFMGLRGNDNINGGAGDNDKAIYYDDVWSGGQFGIDANLTTGKIKDGFGNIDTVSNIEWVLGTRFNDKFVGSAKRDVFIGDKGVDSYDGGANPTTDSGDSDRIQFNWTFSDAVQTGVNVDLSKATGQVINDGYGNVETAINIEGVIGSRQNDTLKGNSGNNLFAGEDGKDTMTGGTGNDEFIWWDQNHFGDGDIITDFNASLDKLSFASGSFNGMDAIRIENDLTPNTALGTFLFDNATDILYWDENGSGANGRFAIVKLTGVTALTTANFELF